jgi:hypothetical protein
MQPMTHRFTLELRKLERDSHDACSVCAKRFQEGETAYSGYDANGTPLYVGVCCSPRIIETAARYWWSPRPYEVPPQTTSLWRYMDLAKFLYLLRDKSLYFARLDQLGDSWEGAKGARRNKQIWDDHYLRFFQDAIRNPPEGYKCEKTQAEIEAEASHLLKQLELGGSIELRTTYVSCWHENEVESEALWRLYCPPNSVGIAIRTTCGDLKLAFDEDLSVEIGRVEYVDFRTEFAGVNDSIFRKRKSLQHEQEVRAVVRDRSENKSLGISRPVNLTALAKEVVISPFAPVWIESILGDLLQRYAVSLPVRVSDLLSEPFF